MDAVSPGLKEAVERLYPLFRGYRLTTPLHERYGEPVKEPVTSELRAMTAEELELPIGHAMTTWGYVEDFKHVLPRIAELIARGEMGAYDQTMALGFHLACGEWREWPREEQEAIERFVYLLWEEVLVCSEDPEGFRVSDQDEPLNIMVRAGVDLRPALLRWQELLETDAGHRLWYMVADTHDRALEEFFSDGKIGVLSTYEKSPEPTRVFLEWVTSDGLRLAVERAMLTTLDEELAVDLHSVSIRIEEIRSIVSRFRDRSA